MSLIPVTLRTGFLGSRIVFIGRDMPRAAILDGREQCLVKE